MSSLNKVLIMGHLTRDPECRYTPKGTAVGEIGLAVNRRVKDAAGNWSDEVTFMDVVLWSKDAENAQKYLTKGRGVFVEGRLQLDTWEDKQSGQKRSKLKVVAEVLQFLPDGKGGTSNPGSTTGGAGTGRPVNMPTGPAPGASDDDDSNIPF